jgi:hypothetical protein
MNLLELQKSKEKKLKLSVGQRLKMPPSHNWNSHEHHYHPDKFILQFYDVYMENSIPLHWTGVLPFLQAASQIVARHEDTWERKHPFIQTWVSTTHRNTRTKADTYISGAEMQIKKLYVHYSSKDYKINYLSVFHIITRWSIFLTLSIIVVLIIKFFLFFLS